MNGGCRIRFLLLFVLTIGACPALTPADVLVVGNRKSPLSRSIVEYYARARAIPQAQVLMLNTTTDEEIPRGVFDKEIAAPLASFLKKRRWVEKILVVVTTSGVPLKIRGTQGPAGTAASVDSEIAALYQDLHGQPHRVPSTLPNPYFQSNQPFTHPEVPAYLVARLTGYTFADVRAIIDRAQQARNTGIVVLDQRQPGVELGDNWLDRAARALPKDRVLLEETERVVYGARFVIGYASWGSNDPNRHDRDQRFQYLPGALVTEYVSTDGRTFQEPPAGWKPSGDWEHRAAAFAGAPQTMAADFLRQGATGVSGHVYEPYLHQTPRPEILFPAYLAGRTLAESFWAAIPAISWMNIVVGDPLCRLAP